MVKSFCDCVSDRHTKRFLCKCNSNLATKVLISSDNEKVIIENSRKIPSVVLLLPVTRQDSTILETLNKVFKTVQNSNVQAIVVIDKTDGAVAYEFFMSKAQELNVDLYILLRHKSEAIFESQKYIQLEDFQWIIQLHDDDKWEGRIQIPDTAKGNQVFLNNFFVEDQNKVEEPLQGNMPPARIVFSLIPTSVWNRFSDFIFAQGGKVAGSADSVLNFISQMSCDFHKLNDFKYIYSASNWGSNEKAVRHLKSLAAQDHWGDLASVDIAILNRNLDLISALNFFKDLIPADQAKEMKDILLSSFTVSIQRKVYLFLNAWLFNNHRTHEKIQAHKLLKVMRASWGITSLAEALIFLNFLSGRVESKSLLCRIEFWKKEFNCLE